MRVAILALLAGCHAAPPAKLPASTTPAAAPAQEQECPVRWVGPSPEVVRVDSLAAAKLQLAAVTPDASEDPEAVAKERGTVFFMNVLRGAEHGSDTMIYDVAGVFVAGDHVVIAKRVALWISTLPAPGREAPRDRSTIEVLTAGSGEHRHIGHMHVVRGNHIVDHFIDLDDSRYLLGLESDHNTTTPWRLDDTGPVMGDCTFYWDD